jgi:hypothetical protein
MGERQIRIVVITMIAAVAAACGGAAPSQTPSATAPAASSFDEYAIAFCSAWEALFLAVGNPDTGEGSLLSEALDEAVATGNGAKAEELGAQMSQALKSGRRDAAIGGGWPPATPIMVQLDRVLAGFEVMTAAKVAKAKGSANAVDPEAALEGSGALVAWTAMFEAYGAMAPERPAEVQPCGDLPISP